MRTHIDFTIKSDQAHKTQNTESKITMRYCLEYKINLSAFYQFMILQTQCDFTSQSHQTMKKEKGFPFQLYIACNIRTY